MPNPDPCPKCPRCKTTRQVYEDGDRGFWCDDCKIAFDDDPDEGGTHSDNPVRSAERTEEHESRQAAYHKRHGRQPRLHRHRRMGR